MALGHGPIASSGIAGQKWNQVIFQKAVAAGSTVLVSRLCSVLVHKTVTSTAIAAKQRVIALYRIIISTMVLAFTHLASFLKSLSTSCTNTARRVNVAGKNLFAPCTSTVRRVYNLFRIRAATVLSTARRVNRVGKNMAASFTIGNILLHHRTALRALLSPAGTTIGPIFRRFISYKRAVVITTTPRLVRFYKKATMLVASLVSTIRKNKIIRNFVTDNPFIASASLNKVRGDTKHLQLVLTGVAHNFNSAFKHLLAVATHTNLIQRVASIYRMITGTCVPVISKYRNLIKSLTASAIAVATMARYRTILRSLQAVVTNATTMVKTALKNLRATETNTAISVKSVLMNRIAISVSIVRRVRVAFKNFAIASVSIASRTRTIAKSFATSSTGLAARLNNALKNARAIATNVSRRVNQVGKNALATEVAVLRNLKATSLFRIVTSTAIATRLGSLVRTLTATATVLATRTRTVFKNFLKNAPALATRTRTVLMNRSSSSTTIARAIKSVNMSMAATYTAIADITNSTWKYLVATSTSLVTRTRTVFKNFTTQSSVARLIIKSVSMIRSALNNVGVARHSRTVNMQRQSSSTVLASIVNSARKNLAIASTAIATRTRIAYKGFTRILVGTASMLRSLPYHLTAISNATVARTIKMVNMNRFASYSSTGLFVPRINRIFLATGSNFVSMQRLLGRNLLAVSSSVARMVRMLARNMLKMVSPVAVRGYNLFMSRLAVSTAFSYLPKTLIFAPKLATSITIAFRQPITVLKNLIVTSALVLRLINFAVGLAKPNKARTITVKPRVRTIKVRK